MSLLVTLRKATRGQAGGAARHPVSPGVEPGQGLEEAGDTFEGTVVLRRPRAVLPL